MLVAMWMACGLLTVEPDTVDPDADVGDVVRPERGDRGDRPDRVLGFEGMDDVHFGMDRAEVEAALGHALYGDSTEGCHYLTPKPEDEKSAVRLMFDEGKLRRIDVTGPAIEIEGGGHVGMQAGEIRALYPGIVEQPHKYETGALYLIVDPPAVGDGKVIFETNAAGRVKSARAGIEPNVSFVEGCG